MTITALPTAPSRATPATFSTLADAWVAALAAFTTEANALEVAANANEVATNADVVSTNANVLLTQAAAVAAQASANYIGEWSAQTGAKTVPTSVSHNNAYWQLTSNIADITAKEPGVDSEWIIIHYAIPETISYGVEWDEDETSPTLTRIGALAGIAAASSPGNSCLPIQAMMRRCVMADDGTVNYYLDADDSTLKEDGATASVLTGADGQVMVEIPKFAYKYAYNTVTNVHSWLISSVLLPGYEWHPAFYKNAAWVDHRYIGAYEGVGWDASEAGGTYIDNGNVAATGWSGGAIDTANDKLSSVSGKNPITEETRDEFRLIAAKRGTGWRQQDFYLSSAIQLLYVTEYASWNSQAMIGMGRTQLTGGTWVQGSYIKETGLSNGDGNGTNAVAYSGDADDVGAEAAYMTYRGIENFYGNIWKWVDGFNINGGIPYASNVDTDFADDTATGAGSTYARLLDINGDGITLPQGANDYQSTLEQIKGGFLPSALGGSASTYITDYYYQAAGWRVATLGSNANYALYAGVACWNLSDTSGVDHFSIGGRLSY